MKQTESIKQLLKRKDASTQAGDLSYESPIPAGQEVSPIQNAVHVIRERVIVEHPLKYKKKPPTKVVARFLLRGNLLYRVHQEKSACTLSPKRVHVLTMLIEASHEYVSSNTLQVEAGYIDRGSKVRQSDAFKAHIYRLKKWGRGRGGLKTSIIEGKSGHGYRIPPNISIQRILSGKK